VGLSVAHPHRADPGSPKTMGEQQNFGSQEFYQPHAALIRGEWSPQMPQLGGPNTVAASLREQDSSHLSGEGSETDEEDQTLATMVQGLLLENNIPVNDGNPDDLPQALSKPRFHPLRFQEKDFAQSKSGKLIKPDTLTVKKQKLEDKCLSLTPDAIKPLYKALVNPETPSEWRLYAKMIKSTWYQLTQQAENLIPYVEGAYHPQTRQEVQRIKHEQKKQIIEERKRERQEKLARGEEDPVLKRRRERAELREKKRAEKKRRIEKREDGMDTDAKEERSNTHASAQANALADPTQTIPGFVPRGRGGGRQGRRPRETKPRGGQRGRGRKSFFYPEYDAGQPDPDYPLDSDGYRIPSPVKNPSFVKQEPTESHEQQRLDGGAPRVASTSHEPETHARVPTFLQAANETRTRFTSNSLQGGIFGSPSSSNPGSPPSHPQRDESIRTTNAPPAASTTPRVSWRFDGGRAVSTPCGQEPTPMES